MTRFLLALGLPLALLCALVSAAVLIVGSGIVAGEVAYTTSDLDGAPAVFLIDVDRGVRVRLWRGISYPAAWSPDGERLLLIGSTTVGTQSVILIDSAGTLIYSRSDAYMPAWSPDGRTFAYIGIIVDTDFGPTISDVIISDGTAEIPLTTSAAFESHPQWSPDGGSITFTTDDYSLQSVQIDTGERQTLVEYLSDGFAPARWLPDGDSLVYISYSGGVPQTVVQNLATGERRLFDEQYRVAGVPVYAPDGRYAAFYYRDGGRSLNLYLRDNTTGEVWRISDNPYDQTAGLSWSADSTRLAYSVGNNLYVTSVAARDQGRLLCTGCTFPAWRP